mmetsp:Transcript_2498/g.5297  ORF Transcript_2498/g.5297 Transcript_2498/m.5297 type:complete len:290 (-) Transcript_2498:174-1043(-)
MTMTMTRSLILALALALSTHHASAFSTPSQSTASVVRAASALGASADNGGHSSSQQRRAVLSSIFTVASATLGAGILPAYAGLLDDYGTDPNSNKQPEPKKEQARNKGKAVSNSEPNLRSNYYYPTNKVRYLPRIKKCSDAIPGAAEAIGREDWDAVRDFAKVVADDTILPMELYVSSLGGGGTNVKVGFAKDMMTAAKSFKKDQALLVKGLDKKDSAKSSAALEGMAEAMLTYRTSGRLLGPDGGGDIPSVDEIRRSTKRARGDTFAAVVTDRDDRVRAAREAAAAGN